MKVTLKASALGRTSLTVTPTGARVCGSLGLNGPHVLGVVVLHCGSEKGTVNRILTLNHVREIIRKSNPALEICAALKRSALKSSSHRV